MALKADFTKTEQNFNGSLVAKNVYWKIDNVAGNKQKCKITVGAYVEPNERMLGNLEFYFVPKMNDSNFIAQAYEHLKTLSEFSGATDC